MTTVINTPANNGGDSGFGFVVGVFVVVALITLFILYAVPMLKNKQVMPAGETNINVQLPATAPVTTPTPK